MFDVGLNPYGLTYTLGLQGHGGPRANPKGGGLEGFIAHFGYSLNELRETNRQINALVSNPELKTAIADASASAGRARQIIERAEKPVNQMLTDLPQATESLSRLVKRLDSVATDLPETSGQLRQTNACSRSGKWGSDSG